MAGACSLSHPSFHQMLKPQCTSKRGRVLLRTRAVSEVVEAAQNVAAPDLTWQIAAGAIAGVTPFVVAGVEFSKRIAAQRMCVTCGGSGLVKKGAYFFRCGSCGYLPQWSVTMLPKSAHVKMAEMCGLEICSNRLVL